MCIGVLGNKNIVHVGVSALEIYVSCWTCYKIKKDLVRNDYGWKIGIAPMNYNVMDNIFMWF